MSLSELIAIQKRIFSFLTPYWRTALAAILCTIFVALAQLFQAKLIGWLFTVISEGNAKISSDLLETSEFAEMPTARGLSFVVGAFLILVLARGVGSYFQKYLTEMTAQSAVRDLRESVFTHLQGLSLRFFESMRLGEIQSRSTADVLAATAIYGGVVDFLKNSIISLGAIGAMLYLDYRMTVTFLVLSPFFGIVLSKFGQTMGRFTENLQSRVADLSSILLENTSSQKVIKAFHREAFEIERYQDKSDDNFKIQMKLAQTSAAQTPVMELISVLAVAVIVYFGAIRILRGQSTLGTTVEYWALMAILLQPVTELSRFYSSLHASSAAAKRVLDLLDTSPDIIEKRGAITLSAVAGHLVFDNVHFAYDGNKAVLRGINLEIKPGEVVAIVGTNGAGKTSLVNLVPRLYDPTGGAILLDGRDLRELTLTSVRNQVATVIQESVLFGGTIAENIACGREDYTRNQIIEAAEASHADKFIVHLEDGYDTDIGERGVRLSGGQRQRIAIARALLRKPKILILDEFTSGIDTESENAIAETIEEVMRGRTCLIIAHRLNTIRKADRIIVLDAGQIVEEGTHDILRANQGLYRKLYEAQLRTV